MLALYLVKEKQVSAISRVCVKRGNRTINLLYDSVLDGEDALSSREHYSVPSFLNPLSLCLCLIWILCGRWHDFFAAWKPIPVLFWQKRNCFQFKIILTHHRVGLITEYTTTLIPPFINSMLKKKNCFKTIAHSRFIIYSFHFDNIPCFCIHQNSG